MLISTEIKRCFGVAALIVLSSCGGGGSVDRPTENAAPRATEVTIIDDNGGNLLPGDQLSGAYEYSDAENDAEGSSIYSWTRNGDTISGASAQNYQVKAADIGGEIAFHITPVAVEGTVQGTMASSSPMLVTSPVNLAPIANAGPDVNILVGETAVFTTQGSRDPDGTLVDFSWSDSEIAGDPPSRVYNQAGSFVVTLTVTDDDGAQAFDTVVVNVTVMPNIAPEAVAGANQSDVVGSVLTFDGGASSDQDGAIVTWQWFLGDATTAFANNSQASLRFDSIGIFNVTLVVTDDAGATGRDTLQVTITELPNQSPNADAGEDQTVVVGASFTLDGSGSTDPDGSIVSYNWDNGLTGATPTTIYESPGQFTIILTVTDDAGATASDQVQITVVSNQAPVANAGADIAILAGETANFDGSASTDADGTIASYAWSNGLSGVNPTRMYNEAGVYDVTLTVTDNLGKSATDVVRVTVTEESTNAAPIADAGEDIQLVVGASAQFDASGSSDPDGTIASYSWSNGLSGVSPTLVYEEVGSFNVVLTVTDNQGASDTDSLTVNVTVDPNLAPEASAAAVAPIQAGERAYFDGSASSGVDDEIVSYQWSNGLSGATGSLVYNEPGVYEVTLYVTDEAGARAQTTVTVTVSEKSGSILPPTKAIYYFNATNWQTPYAYVWGSVPANSLPVRDWPGYEMSYLEALDVWYLEVGDDTDSANVVFSDSGITQTADLGFSGDLLCYRDGTWNTLEDCGISSIDPLDAGPDRRAELNSRIALTANASRVDVSSATWSSPAWGGTLTGATVVTPPLTSIGAHVVTLSLDDGSTDTFTLDVITANTPFTERPLLVEPLNFPLAGSVSTGDYDFEPAFPNIAEDAFTSPVMVTHDGVNDFIYVVDKAGTLSVFPNDPEVQANQIVQIMDIRNEVRDFHEQGLLSIAFHPEFASNRYAYIYYIEGDNDTEGQSGAYGDAVLQRIQLDSSSNPTSVTERVDVLVIPQPGPDHKGGMMQFHPLTGEFYMSIGDGAYGATAITPKGNDRRTNNSAQETDNLRGTFIRLTMRETANTDGKYYDIPADNPFVNDDAILDEIWSYGHRNPWRWAFDPVAPYTLWETEVGQSGYEEVNIIEAGGNYGWPICEGTIHRGDDGGDPNFTRQCSGDLVAPEGGYDQSSGSRSIIGGFVYRGTQLPGLTGKFIYGDYVSKKIWTKALGEPAALLTNGFPASPSSFGTDLSGQEVFVSSHGAEPERGGPSTIYRVVDRAVQAVQIPATLSETGLFADLEQQFPVQGLIEYGVSSKPWLDGAQVRHFVAVPNDAQINFNEADLWSLPVGSVLVKHIDLPLSASTTRPFETSVLFKQNAGNWAAANYHWNEAGTDAALVEEAGEELVQQFLNGEQFMMTRSILSGADCSSCHIGNGSTDPLGFGVHQLNHQFDYQGVSANQVDVFSSIKLLDATVDNSESLPRFVDPAIVENDLDERARAYLHTNCAHCHGGSFMDLRYDTALQDMDIMNVERSNGIYRMLPFNADASLLHIYQVTDSNRMPRGSQLTDPVADALFQEWINADAALATGLSVGSRQDAAAITSGDAVDIFARISYDNGFETVPTGGVSWSSSDPSVLPVSGSAGEFTVIAGVEGTATVSASAEGFDGSTLFEVSGSSGLARPSNLSATALSSVAISLTWTDNASLETEYRVSRSSTLDGTYAPLATLAVNASSYIDNGLTPDTRYYYRVEAWAEGQSSLATQASAKTSVASAVDSIAIISGAEPVIVSGEQRQVAATAMSAGENDGVTSSVTWVSSDTDVAAVSSNGLVTGGSQAGTAIITASYQGLQDTLEVRNLGPASYAYINKPNEWAQATIYTWTGTNTEHSGAWPGTAMTPAVDLGGNWYRFPIAAAWGASVNLIFNCGSDACQTENLVMPQASSAWYQDETWLTTKPLGGGGVESGTQIQVGNGEVTWANNGSNLSGRLFIPGALVDVTATAAGPGMVFVGWEGTGAPYLLDAHSASTQMVVDDALSHTLLAVFDSVEDSHVLGREFYQGEGCGGCHGDDGATETAGKTLLDVQSTYDSIESLAAYIEANMPLGAAGDCVGDCATRTAAMIWEGAFLPPTGVCNADSLDSLVPPDRSLRLLSTAEYNNSVRDLLRLNIAVDVTSGRIPADIPVNGFKTNANAVFTNDYARGYVVAAEAAAELVDGITALAPSCGTDIECIVRSFGKRAYRRPLTNAEVTELLQVHTDQGDLALMSTMLSSPFMLYRSELGEATGSGYYQLTDYEVATLLAYTFWATTPDDALLAMADAGQLSTREQVATQVEAMLMDPRAELAFERFVKGWLDIDKEIKSSGLSDDLKQDMTEETLRFVKNVVFGGGNYRELITADYSYMTEQLAQHYGLQWPGGTAQWQRVNYQGVGNAERRGVLGHAGILSRQSASERTHPVKRGLFVRKNLLCQDFPPPPIGAALKPQEDPSLTVRERFEQAHLQDGCESCHQYIDGIGFGLEHYNNFGIWQNTETTPDGTVKPINAAGYIGSLNSAETFLSEREPIVEYSTMNELADLIANSANGKACYARQWYRYTRGQREEVEDSCTLQVFGSEFKTSDNVSLLDLMVQYTQTQNYILRK